MLILWQTETKYFVQNKGIYQRTIGTNGQKPMISNKKKTEQGGDFIFSFNCSCYDC